MFNVYDFDVYIRLQILQAQTVDPVGLAVGRQAQKEQQTEKTVPRIGVVWDCWSSYD